MFLNATQTDEMGVSLIKGFDMLQKLLIVQGCSLVAFTVHVIASFLFLGGPKHDWFKLNFKAPGKTVQEKGGLVTCTKSNIEKTIAIASIFI